MVGITVDAGKQLPTRGELVVVYTTNVTCAGLKCVLYEFRLWARLPYVIPLSKPLCAGLRVSIWPMAGAMGKLQPETEVGRMVPYPHTLFPTIPTLSARALFSLRPLGVITRRA
jgi:hypothetical protein